MALRDKIALLKELKEFLDSIKDAGEGQTDEWLDGFDCVWLAVENWLIDKIVELGGEVKERHV